MIGRWLTGTMAQAVGVAVAVTVVVSAGAWAVHLIRSERDGVWKNRWANARIQDQAKLIVRQRKSESISIRANSGLAAELQAATDRIAELEGKLAERTRVVCYPKAIVPTLNR